eukprot:6616121-Heterocapsa_arctica.AAC.1
MEEGSFDVSKHRNPLFPVAVPLRQDCQEQPSPDRGGGRGKRVHAVIPPFYLLSHKSCLDLARALLPVENPPA